MCGCGKDCLILIPFRLPQISCFTLSLKCFSSDSDSCRCGDQTPASVPPPSEGRASPPNTPISPPSSFVLPSFVWVSIFFSTGQVLLSALSWCSACTSASEGAFPMHPWGEMSSTSTYYSAILFSPWKLFECNFLAWYFDISRWYPLMWLWFSHFSGIYNTLGSTYWYLDLGIFPCHLYFLPFFFFPLFSLSGRLTIQIVDFLDFKIFLNFFFSNIFDCFALSETKLPSKVLIQLIKN